MKFLSTIILFFAAFTAGAQLTEGIEYFWDTDPGIGNGIYVPFETPQAEINTALELDVTGLTYGKHRLFMRSKRTDGSYGIPLSKAVYIPRQLTTAEYFWDTDPGEGNGSPLHLQYNGTVVQMCDHVSTTALTAGTHYLFVRTKSTDGVWSHPNKSVVTIEANEIPTGCPGDFDYNGSINTGDLLSFLSYIGATGDCTFDLTDDLTINTSDILILLGVFGTECQ